MSILIYFNLEADLGLFYLKQQRAHYTQLGTEQCGLTVGCARWPQALWGQVQCPPRWVTLSALHNRSITNFVLKESSSQMGLQKWKAYLISRGPWEWALQTPNSRRVADQEPRLPGCEMHRHAWAKAVLPKGCSPPVPGHSRDSKAGTLGTPPMAGWLKGSPKGARPL